MKSVSALIFFLCLWHITPIIAQRSKERVDFKPSEINRMPIVLIDLIEKSYPRVHLQRVSSSSISVVKQTIHDHTLKTMYFTGEVFYDQIQSITVISKKRKLKTNLLGAAIGGATGYLIGRQFRPGQLRQGNLELISQIPQNGFIEPILGGIVGLGLGTVVGDLFTPIFIGNVNGNPKAAINRLKEFSPTRSKSKGKRR